jgi:hypothetical protein
MTIRLLLVPLLVFAFVGAAQSAAIENPLIASVCGLDPTDGDLASTCLFTANAAGIPISAYTDFIEDWDTIGYSGLTLATHELFHAIGFTTNYANFANNVNPGPPRTIGNLTLTAANQGTHVDPTVAGQANDIMQPGLPLNTVRTLNANDFGALNLAFGYANTGINITVVNVAGTLDDTDIAIVNAAVAAVENQYNVAGQNNRANFIWSVAEAAPEPGTWVFMIGGGALFAVVSRRRLAVS